MDSEYHTGFKHLLCFAAVWWLLTNGSLSSWVIGVIVVPIAACVSVTLFSSTTTMRSSTSLSIVRLVLFIPFFLLQSLRGGWDTARLAIRPSMPVSPGFIHYSIQLPTESARLFFLHVVSLLPGTVSVTLQGNRMLVHALDVSSQGEADLRACEQRVARLFNLNGNRADSISGGTL